MVKTVIRTTGKRKGHVDKYWISPINQLRFSSKVGVRRFLDIQNGLGLDEREAYKVTKNRKKRVVQNK